MTAPQHTVTPSEGVGHTPGPWEVGQHPALRNGWIVRPVLFGSHGWVLKPCEGGHFVLRNEADAHLIAAAPDLLEALEKLVGVAEKSIYPKPDVGSDHPYAILCAAKDAIAKATGMTGGDA